MQIELLVIKYLITRTKGLRFRMLSKIRQLHGWKCRGLQDEFPTSTPAIEDNLQLGKSKIFTTIWN